MVTKKQSLVADVEVLMDLTFCLLSSPLVVVDVCAVTIRTMVWWIVLDDGR